MARDTTGGRADALAVARRSVVAKRVFDVVVGTVLAIAATPVILVSAVVLAITLRTWPFFVQQRIGQNGEPLHFLKLRTLPRSTPAYALKQDLRDVRIGRVAHLMRVHHLDELTQLYLVPLGKLSLVGPRPKMPDAVEPVDPYYGAVRTSVPQGCTGLWQIGAHKHLLPNETPHYDYFYVRRSSFVMDLWILWRTALVMLHLGDTIEPAEVPAWVLRRPRPTAGVEAADVIDLTVLDLAGIEASQELRTA